MRVVLFDNESFANQQRLSNVLLCGLDGFVATRTNVGLACGVDFGREHFAPRREHIKLHGLCLV